MKRALFAGSIALASAAAAPALAGGVGDPQPAPVVLPAEPAPIGADWTGFYAGGELGYGDVTVDDATGTEVDGGDGALYTLFGGYRYDFGQFVLGGEIDATFADIDLPGAVNGSLDSVFRAGLEGGFDAGPALLYGTVGAALANVTSGAAELQDTGYFYGIGIDYAVTDSVTVGAELLQHEFEDFDSTGLDVSATTFGINAALRF